MTRTSPALLTLVLGAASCVASPQAKSLLMAIYFGADHFVWAFQIGLITDKKAGERWQKISLYSWALGSVCTVWAEALAVASMRVVRKEVRARPAALRCAAAAARRVGSEAP